MGSAHHCGVSRTSHRLRAETLPIYYGQTTFIAYTAEQLHPGTDPSMALADVQKWLKTIGVEHAGMIKRLIIRVPLPEGRCTWVHGCDDDKCEAAKVPSDRSPLAVGFGLVELGLDPACIELEFGDVL